MSKKNKKKITAASKHRLMTIGLICIGIFLYFCFTVISYSHKIIALTNEEKNLKKELDNLKTQREDLLVEIEKLKDPDYIAKYARENYSYSKNGELVIKMEKSNELETINNSIEEKEQKIFTMDEITNKYKYVIIIGASLLAILVTIHIIKNKI